MSFDNQCFHLANLMAKYSLMQTLTLFLFLFLVDYVYIKTFYKETIWDFWIQIVNLIYLGGLNGHG